jgi:hypothetical protein
MFAKIYAIGSCVIGFLQAIEGLLSLLVSRKVETSNYIFSGVEVMWVPVALISICFLTSNKKHLISPISYVAYIVIGWTISLTLSFLDPQPRDQDYLSPMPFIIAGLLFGIYYLIANIKLYKELKGPTS